MNLDRYRAITYKARKLARQHGFFNDAEDIAQEAAFRIHQNPKAIVPFIFVDYVRTNYGRTGDASAVFKNNERLNYEEVLEMDMEDGSEKLDLDFKRFQNMLEREERIMFTLKFKWGFTELEIAECFGLSEGRVSQVLKALLTKIKTYTEATA